MVVGTMPGTCQYMYPLTLVVLYYPTRHWSPWSTFPLYSQCYCNYKYIISMDYSTVNSIVMTRLDQWNLQSCRGNGYGIVIITQHTTIPYTYTQSTHPLVYPCSPYCTTVSLVLVLATIIPVTTLAIKEPISIHSTYKYTWSCQTVYVPWTNRQLQAGGYMRYSTASPECKPY